MNTYSESIITKINQNVFFKEFTFDNNDFYPNDGKKQLADNIILLDELLFIIQVKERNPASVKSKEDENKWFENTVLKAAKNQIKESLKYFARYSELQIKNIRNQLIEVNQANLKLANKLIIYLPNSSLISSSNKEIKFYESKQVGNIHVLSVEDYFWICRFLITPTEVDEYLKFRKRIYLRHKSIIKIFPEQYILSHFLNTNNESVINEKYIETLSKFDSEENEFDVSGILNNFLEKIHYERQKKSIEYHLIIKEIAKLKRYEMLEFKKRFQTIIEDVKLNSFSLPYRFTADRTGCGFVFIPLMLNKIKYWENALNNYTKIYKYKRKLNKCLGVIVYKFGDYYDIQWSFTNSDWSYDEVLEKAVIQESELYGEGEVRLLERYKFKK